MKIHIKPVTARINRLIEEAKLNGTCSKAFTTVMNFLTQMANEAESAAQTWPPMPRFEYSKTISSELVNELNEEQKTKLEEVGISFRKQAGSFTRVYMIFVTGS